MKDWLKGLVILIVGSVIYEVIPVWIVEYLLDQPNPLYSIGIFFENIPSLQDVVQGNYSGYTTLIIGLTGFVIIGYGLFLFIRDVYRYS